jgi:hypothetical protein
MIFPNFFHPFSFYEASLSILVKTVPITPLHVAFAWPSKTKFKALNFAALTMGAMVPDLEVPVYQLLGFCILTGWCCIFPHRRAERRHCPHSRPCKIARTCQAGEDRHKWIFASAKLDKYILLFLQRLAACRTCL